ncbi:MAG: DPP IV N-terminal domain-containing protein [Planctomycetota bacterium]
MSTWIRSVPPAVLVTLLGALSLNPLVGQDAAAAPRALVPIDMFRLEYFMTLPALEPHGWLDRDHLLLFDPGKPALEGPRSWYALDVRSGARERLVARDAVAGALGDLGVDAQGVAEIDDLDRWTWNGDHTRFVLDVAGDLFVGGRDGAVRRLTATPDAAEELPQWSPDSAWVTFVRQHNVYVVPADGGDEVAITTEGHADRFFGKLDWVYQEEVWGRGEFRATWWSPDGAHLAFLDLDEAPVLEFTLVSDEPARPEVEVVNYPKAGEPNPNVWLCVAPAGGGPITRFDVSEYPDADRLIVRVTWAPDGKEVFFQVQDRAQTWLDLLAGDVATGKVRRVFRETSDCWVEPGPEPRWIDGGAAFLWESERSGYRHLYRYDRAGGEPAAQAPVAQTPVAQTPVAQTPVALTPVALTAGEWQVLEVVATDEASGQVWFLGDRQSPVQTHLYRVPLAGGDVEQVSEGRGTWSAEAAPDCGLFLCEWSSVTTPPRTVVLAPDGSEVRALAEPKLQVLEPYRLAEPELLQIPARDGFPMEAMVLRPRDVPDGTRLPAVQFTYAGPHSPRVRDQWGSRDYVWHQLLVQHGYAVLVCDNRSASGKGRVFHKACWRDLGSSELRDLEDGARWLCDQGIADPERLGIWGWSYGGYQTLFNLTHSDVWRCGVAVNPVTDWRNYDTIYTERYLGTPQDNPEGYQRSSVVAAAADLRGELMLVAAAMDDNVHMQNSLQFLHALQMAGKDCDFMVYPRVRHGIETLPQQLHLFGRMLRFFDRNLKPGR